MPAMTAKAPMAMAGSTTAAGRAAASLLAVAEGEDEVPVLVESVPAWVPEPVLEPGSGYG